MSSNSNSNNKIVYEKGKQFTCERLTMWKMAIHRLPPRYPDLEGTPSSVPRNEVRGYRITSGFTKINFTVF